MFNISAKINTSLEQSDSVWTAMGLSDDQHMVLLIYQINTKHKITPDCVLSELKLLLSKRQVNLSNPTLSFFLLKVLEVISAVCEATDIPVLDFW